MDQDTSVQQDADTPEDQDPNDPEVKYSSELAALRAKHKVIGYWDVPGHGLVACTKPRPVVFKKYVNELNNDKLDKGVVQEQFALHCIVYPDRKTAERILDDLPVFALKVAGRAQKLGGGNIEDLGKD